jgi:hypothetical protein
VGGIQSINGGKKLLDSKKERGEFKGTFIKGGGELPQLAANHRSQSLLCAETISLYS